MDNSIKASIIALLIFFILVVVVSVFSIGEGEEKESLLNFSCEELQHSKISRDGHDGKFVTDSVSFAWADDKLIEEASAYKQCIMNEGLSAEKLNYLNYKKVK